MKNTDRINEFINTLHNTAPQYSARDVFTWLVYAMAALTSIIGEPNPERAKRRQKEGQEYVKKLGGVEVFQKLAQMAGDALEEDREQDFLGTVYQRLNMNDKDFKGQVFSPYNLCAMASKITYAENETTWTAVTDPCCGAGAMLIAHSNVAKAKGRMSEEDFFYVANDIDRFCCAMAAAQMSMLGMAGIVTCSDALLHPVTGTNIFFPEMEHEDDIYYLSGCAYPIWQMRMVHSLVTAKARAIEEELLAEADKEAPKNMEDVPPATPQDEDKDKFRVVSVHDCVQMTLFDLPMKEEVV